MLIPDHETVVDFLNYESISRTVVELLKTNRGRALTIGVHGDWGAGKSSVLKMIEAEVRQDRKISCLWFNGWAFQGFDDAKSVLIEATITELCRQRSTYGKVKELGARLLKRVDWLKVAKRGGGLAFTIATGLPSPDQIGDFVGRLKSLAGSLSDLPREQVEARLSEAAAFFKPAEERHVAEEIHQFREEFSKLLDEAQIDQLVVLIDDLDRCLPATAIDTLEAIRLFLFVPKTAFVIGADEAMIEYAVRQHFPNLPVASGPMPYARNYLEKLIQVPLRIPSLGTQETRTYVTLLLVEALTGDQHEGFQQLLAKARKSLNQPWLGSGLRGEDVRAVDVARRAELDATHLLAQQIGPILAEGSKGNPRQIKRFLNALFIRQAIASARGFGDRVNQAVLAKLMLAERFQPDFYEQIATWAMVAEEGKVSELAELEASVVNDTGRKSRGAARKGKTEEVPPSPDVQRWLEREWLQRWLKIQPALAAIDLRPYVFVARDKRMFAAAAQVAGLDALVEKLCGPALAARSVEPEVRALAPADADQVFNALKERVLLHGDFNAEPPGFLGLGIVAKHHARHQSELLTLIESIDVKILGIWVVKGWGDIITSPRDKGQLQGLLTRWATQDDNALLKKAAANQLAPLGRGSS